MEQRRGWCHAGAADVQPSETLAPLRNGSVSAHDSTPPRATVRTSAQTVSQHGKAPSGVAYPLGVRGRGGAHLDGGEAGVGDAGASAEIEHHRRVSTPGQNRRKLRIRQPRGQTHRNDDVSPQHGEPKYSVSPSSGRPRESGEFVHLQVTAGSGGSAEGTTGE